VNTRRNDMKKESKPSSIDPAAATREPAERTRERPVHTPRTDIYETEKEVVLVADMPGVGEKGIEVTLERNVLTIVGRTEDAAPEGFRLAYAEFERGDYQRSFVLSGQADANGIQASIRDGVLRVSVPKTKPALKRIPVASGG
jgi:HSP20 family molecular chaperone IbpA